MAVNALKLGSDCGAVCIQCGEMLVAPEWSEYVHEGLVLNLWSCSKCGCRFETEVTTPAGDKSAIDAVTVEAFFPSLLVA